MNLERTLTEIRQTRKNIIGIADSLNLEEINQIPAGFNNNIAWNLGHVIASQQILCYKLSGLPMYISADFAKKYGKGSRPEIPISQQDLDAVKSDIMSFIDKLEKDLNDNLFQEFTKYETSYGITLENIMETLQFMKMHEAMHLGYIMAQKRALLDTR